jgi:hypothetical protein
VVGYSNISFFCFPFVLVGSHNLGTTSQPALSIPIPQDRRSVMEMKKRTKSQPNKRRF